MYPTEMKSGSSIIIITSHLTYLLAIQKPTNQQRKVNPHPFTISKEQHLPQFAFSRLTLRPTLNGEPHEGRDAARTRHLGGDQRLVQLPLLRPRLGGAEASAHARGPRPQLAKWAAEW